MYRPIVYIVDDDPSVGKSLTLWLGFRGFATRGFDAAESFLQAVDHDCQGCAIVDVRLGGMDGLQLQSHLSERKIGLPVIFLTGHGDVSTTRAALKGGAFDFVEKPVDNDRIVQIVGGALVEDERRWRNRQESQRVRERLERLTAREREVLDHVLAGRQNREIAVHMGISARTVEVYKARLMDKLDVRRVPDLVRMMLRADD